MTIIGTRPEIIRLSACIKACDKYFDQILVHTGQNWDYSLNEVFFKDLQLREPDYYLDSVGANLGETMGNIIAKSYKVMLEEKPDGTYIVEMRNRFKKGDVLEILSPRSIGEKTTVLGIVGEDGVEKDEAILVQENVTVYCDKKLLVGDMLRKRI